MVRVAHDVGVPKNLVLEFDAVRVALGRAARSDVKNKVFSLPENFLELGAERVAGMLPRNYHVLGHENRHALFHAKFGAALGALNRRGTGLKERTTPRTSED